MGKPTITLYVDTVSPFAYEAYHILRVRPYRHITSHFSQIAA